MQVTMAPSVRPANAAASHGQASRTSAAHRPFCSGGRLRSPPAAAVQRAAECRTASQAEPAQRGSLDQRQGSGDSPSRRNMLLSGAAAAAAAAFAGEQPAEAIQGITAGRLPGLSKTVDAEGFHTYQRPEGKSGGHGVGWSEIPRYSFKIPDGWEETPVSIADLGGTEIDLRYAASKEGDVVVIVAPVLRFKDVGFNADVSLEDLGPPERLIAGFAPEVIGGPLPDDGVTSTEVVTKGGRTYYQWEVDVKGATKPYHYIAATAVGNRAFLLACNANGRQWRAGGRGELLRKIQVSFYVPPKVPAA